MKTPDGIHREPTNERTTVMKFVHAAARGVMRYAPPTVFAHVSPTQTGLTSVPSCPEAPAEQTGDRSDSKGVRKLNKHRIPE